jgi:hypothetical protein
MSGIPYANGEGVLLSDWGDVIDRHDLLVRCNGFIGVDVIQILDFFDRMRQFTADSLLEAFPAVNSCCIS